ncbi:GvpL/GvpF family gas vesicle protein [Streptomyces sp. PU10]|uniref:GvpL/GvpF family gas vesicle protein n=1 Tax=Streptomyces sp. PU10 TaxID=3062780 RepID=UPI0028FC3490|nr:GvpL/GvpF family gas vesicle protein [Streptomyces sp. PU10]MDU0258072.1 GvpL/GvpF family gas vesicle protein [Streptomyces sp. PU10]
MSTTDAGPQAPGIVCAFAVSRTPPNPALLAAARGHEEGGPLRVVRAGGLCLVVQDVPAALFDEEALTERLNRPGDLERCARAHHRGVEAAAAGRVPVVPLPMATLYRGDLTAARAVTARLAGAGDAARPPVRPYGVGGEGARRRGLARARRGPRGTHRSRRRWPRLPQQGERTTA